MWPLIYELFDNRSVWLSKISVRHNSVTDGKHVFQSFKNCVNFRTSEKGNGNSKKNCHELPKTTTFKELKLTNNIKVCLKPLVSYM